MTRGQQPLRPGDKGKTRRGGRAATGRTTPTAAPFHTCVRGRRPHSWWSKEGPGYLIHRGRRTEQTLHSRDAVRTRVNSSTPARTRHTCVVPLTPVPGTCVKTASQEPLGMGGSVCPIPLPPIFVNNFQTEAAGQPASPQEACRPRGREQPSLYQN